MTKAVIIRGNKYKIDVRTEDVEHNGEGKSLIKPLVDPNDSSGTLFGGSGIFEHLDVNGNKK